ncbi:MAG: hypothetical protein IPO87_18805 [Flavobacteriales bacterium]|nr:hypothetical protein [Flavobacteriales bacterium]
MRDYIMKQNSGQLLTHWNIAVILNSSSQHPDQFKFREVKKQDFKWAAGGTEGGLSARSLVYKDGKLVVYGGKNAILDKGARMADLHFNKPRKEISEDDIRSKRNELGIPLLIIQPIDERVSNKKHMVPFIGVGIQFPEIKGEMAFEYAVRPMVGMDEEVQVSDDPADNDD